LVIVFIYHRIIEITQDWTFVLGTFLLILLFVFPGGIVGGLHALWIRVRGQPRA
jgi:hypothetical protein